MFSAILLQNATPGPFLKSLFLNYLSALWCGCRGVSSWDASKVPATADFFFFFLEGSLQACMEVVTYTAHVTKTTVWRSRKHGLVEMLLGSIKPKNSYTVTSLD